MNVQLGWGMQDMVELLHQAGHVGKLRAGGVLSHLSFFISLLNYWHLLLSHYLTNHPTFLQAVQSVAQLPVPLPLHLQQLLKPG